MPVSTNDFANKLWKVADFYDEFGLSPKIAALLHDASNIARSFSGIVDKNDELKAENAKLRELVALWSVINKHMSLCATTDCEQCPVKEECRESVHLEGLLGIDSKELSWRVQERMAEATDVQDESAKLRELVADMWFWGYCGHMDSKSKEWQMKHIDGVLDRMRELRIEVNG